MRNLVKGLVRIRSGASVLAAAFIALLVVGVSPAFAATGGSGNGTFEVQVLKAGTWTTVASPGFGTVYSTRSVSLGGDLTQVRLVQRGGTAAQLDSVLLDGTPATAVSGSSDALAIKKLAATDNDVTNAFDDTLVLTFPASGSTLSIDARIQGDISHAFPFEYPQANEFLPVTTSSSFYQVDLAGLPAAIDTSAKPFVRALAEPGTGHPKGYTYVWLAKTDRDLLVTIDFTSDNTMDGNDDYAKVHVKTATGVKDFKQTVGERTWGDVAFTYTDKVSYQHKLYTFSIPLSEVGVGTGKAELSFTTYGTSAITLMPVYRFYNVKNDSHFYTADETERAMVVATLGSTYLFDGVAYTVNTSNGANNAPLYRFYNKMDGSHFYTMSAAERDSVVANLAAVYRLEGTAYNVSATSVPGATTVYRFYNKMNGTHFYTASVAERDAVVANLSAKYTLEGPAFYLAP
jgi:hypothetical protein